MALEQCGWFVWSADPGPGSDWMDLGPPDWYADAACREHEELEFVLLPRGGAGAEVEKRKTICRDCLVRRECLAYALADDTSVGIWGGTTDRERRAIRGPKPRRNQGPVPRW